MAAFPAVTVLPGGSLKSLRRTNSERVLRLLLQNGAMHRAEIARQVDVSRATISTIVNELLERGVLVQVGVPSSAELDGRVRELVAVDPSAGVAAGVGLAGGRVTVYLSDLEHRPLADREVAVGPGVSDLELVDLAAALLDESLEGAGLSRDDLLGLGVGGPARGPLRQLAEDRFAGGALVEDAERLAAMAEYQWGAGERAGTMLHVMLAEEVSATLIAGGAIYGGAWGRAGQLGHFSVDFEGPACPCGNRGCLVQKAGTAAVLRDLRPLLGDAAGIEDVVAAARAGDRSCLGVLGDLATLVGRVLANLANLLDPGRIVLAGPLTALGDMFLDPVRAALARHAVQDVAATTVVVPAAFQDAGQACARGGAALVLQEAPKLAAVLDGKPPGVSAGAAG